MEKVAWENILGRFFYLVKQSQILYLKAFDNYCYIITAEREYLAEQLNSEKFIKTHRSYFVNLLKIDALRTDSLLLNNLEIPVSNSKKAKLKELIQRQ